MTSTHQAPRERRERRAIELEVDLIPGDLVEHHVEVLAQVVVAILVIGEQRGLRGDRDLPARRVQLVDGEYAVQVISIAKPDPEPPTRSFTGGTHAWHES